MEPVSGKKNIRVLSVGIGVPEVRSCVDMFARNLCDMYTVSFFGKRLLDRWGWPSLAHSFASTLQACRLGNVEESAGVWLETIPAALRIATLSNVSNRLNVLTFYVDRVLETAGAWRRHLLSHSVDVTANCCRLSQSAS